jgi:hypothetical protein
LNANYDYTIFHVFIFFKNLGYDSLITQRMLCIIVLKPVMRSGKYSHLE